MISTKTLRYLSTLAATLTLGVAMADDTELFMYQSGANAPNPNVLIVLDTSANWQTRYATERAALLALGDYFATTGPTGASRGNVNVGLQTATGGNVDGAYLRFGLREMSNQTNRTAWKKTAETLNNDSTEKSNAPNPGLQYWELYQYLTGGNAISGSASNYRDYYQNGNSRSPWGAYFKDVSPASNTFPLGSAGATTYQQPGSISQTCARNYIIYISNGKVSGNSQAEQRACQALASLGGDAANQLSISPNSLQSNCVDEWARFLFKKDFASNQQYAGLQNVVTYMIEVEPATDTTSQSMTALLKSAANAGGGEYYAVTDAGTSAQLQAILEKILNQIQAVNSVFASVSLPVSVNQRSTNLNQVYMGVFRPDANASPRWLGNLKEYQLGFDTTTSSLMLIDARSNPTSPTSAVDAATGFIKHGMYSFWTYDDQYWSFAPDPNAPGPASDGPDGPMVERGAAAQLMRMLADGSGPQKPSARNVFTYTGTGTQVDLTGCGTSCEFSTTNSSVTATLAPTLIDWVRGADNKSTEGEYGVVATFGGGTTTSLKDTEIRPSVHGDVLHSRPAVINYNRTGTATNPDPNDVVVFYGANDGTLRAIQGGQAPYSGFEKWAFVAQETYSKLDRLWTNSPPITPPGTTAPTTIGGLSVTAGSNVITGFALGAADKLRLTMTASGLPGIPPNAYIVGFPFCSAIDPTLVCVALSQNATASGLGSITFTPNPRPYFFDGAVVPWVTPDATSITPTGTNKAYIFASMRRGGRMVYAFDVTDPDRPVLMWRRGCPNETNNTGCDPGWEEIGQTWSAPNVTAINASLGGSNPNNLALIFGAGYDPQVEDQDPIPASGGPSRTMGRGIYVVNAITGAIIRRFVSGSASGSGSNTTTVAGMNYAIPSDVAIVARSHLTNNTVPAYRAYVGDTGGNLWRLDLSNADPGKWIVTKLASLGGTGANARKFLYPPDVVLGDSTAAYPTGNFDFVVIGSGDREHPLNGLTTNPNYPDSVTIINRFYMIKDNSTGETYDAGNPPTFGGVTEADLFDTTSDLVQSTDTTTAQTALNALNSAKGWYITLLGLGSSGGASAGEKTVGAAATAAGVVYFGTHQPSPATTSNVCRPPLGIARLYAIDLVTGGAIPNYFIQGTLSAIGRFTTVAGGGFPPSPVPVAVKIGDSRREGVISGTQVLSTATGVGDRLRSFIRVIHDRRTPN